MTTLNTYRVIDMTTQRTLCVVESVSVRGALSKATRLGHGGAYRHAVPLGVEVWGANGLEADSAPEAVDAMGRPSGELTAAQRYSLSLELGYAWLCTDCAHVAYGLEPEWELSPASLEAGALYSAWEWARPSVLSDMRSQCSACGAPTGGMGGMIAERVTAPAPTEAPSVETVRAQVVEALRDWEAPLAAEVAEMEAELTDAEWIEDYAPEAPPASLALEPRDWEAYDSIPEADWQWHAVRWEAGHATAERETFPTERERDRFTAGSWGTWRAAGAPPVSARSVSRKAGRLEPSADVAPILREWLGDAVNAGCHYDSAQGYWVINTVTELATYSRKGN